MGSAQSNSRIAGPMSIPTTLKPTTKSKKTGPYDPNFLQHLIDNGIYPHGYRHPDGRVPPRPDNWEKINQILLRRRPSLTSSRFLDKEFERFEQADTTSRKENQVTTSVIPIIQGDIGDQACLSGGIPFNNLAHLTDGTISAGNPDVYYGARPEQLDRRVRDQLGDQIIPSRQGDLPIAPNFFLAVKGPNGTIETARNQACYDGALGARAMHSLRSYAQTEPVSDNDAAVITSMYHGGMLTLFTSHQAPTTNPEGRPEYYMHRLKAWAMISDVETFRQGATAYKNARDWAKEQRDEAIRRANERVSACQAHSLSNSSNSLHTSRNSIENTKKKGRTPASAKTMKITK